MSLDLLFIRHGQTDWNPMGRVMGRSDIPINAEGIRQIENTRDWLKAIEVHAIYSSPMVRAMQSAAILAKGLGGLTIIPDDGLAEIDYGDWVGLLFKEIEKNHNEEYNNYRFRASKMKIPGGEAVVGVQRRAVGTIERIRARHEGERVVVVSHADVIKSMILHYLGMPLDHLQAVGCDNGSLSIYRFGTAWGDRLVALNYFADVKKILPW